MKECDIFRGAGRLKHTLTPPTYFQGVKTCPTAPDGVGNDCDNDRDVNKAGSFKAKAKSLKAKAKARDQG